MLKQIIHNKYFENKRDSEKNECWQNNVGATSHCNMNMKQSEKKNDLVRNIAAL